MTILQPAEYGSPEDHLLPFYMAGDPGIIRTNITWWLVFHWKKSALPDGCGFTEASRPCGRKNLLSSYHAKKDAEAIFNSGSSTVNGGEISKNSALKGDEWAINTVGT
jgi:hypothetical protein